MRQSFAFNTHGVPYQRKNNSIAKGRSLLAVNCTMAHPLKNNVYFPGKKISSVAPCRNRGAITVEYALCMVVAAALMIGVQVIFSTMAQEIINGFKNVIVSFPNI
jgi:Flp pilus assembly pilin Flp